MSLDNVVSIDSKKKQFGINISFTITCGDTRDEKIFAQAYLERFHDAVKQLQQEGFTRLTATVTSKQEYLP